MLVASHIKPWKHSDVKTERTNPTNGLCLNALHDKAFDQGLISINQKFEIMVSNKLKYDDVDELTKKWLVSFEAKKIEIPHKFLPDSRFIEYHNDVVIIHDLHLQHEDLTAQIDYVVVTRKLVFFIECKNLYGNIEIDNQGNFVRSYAWNGRTVKEGIYSPITQNQRHLEVYRQLRLAQATNPIKRLGFQSGFDNFHQSIVVLANPKTVLNAKYAKKDVKDRVIRADQLIAHIKEQNKKSKELASSEKAMQAWAEKILALHQPLASDYTKKYETILSGVTAAAPAPPKPSGAPMPEIEKPAVRETAATPYTVTSSQNDDLVAKLKAYRLKTSRAEKVQAYVVFNDRQLADLITRKPRTVAELQQISGFGPVKAEKYGPGILAVLNPLEGAQAAASKVGQKQSWSPAQLVGEKITHQSFGSGTVKSVSRHEIIIKFPMTARSFAFPDVFDTTIWLSNPALQQKVEALIKAKKS